MPRSEGYVNFDVKDKMGEEYEKELTDDLIRNFDQMASDRGNLNGHCAEIARLVWPMHRNLFDSFGLQGTQGEKRNQDIMDSAPVLALQRFGAILDSMLTPRNSFWHQLTTDNEIIRKDKKSMEWFEKVNAKLFKERYAPKANFASQNQLVYKSLGAYGTGALFIDQLAGQKGLRYKTVHLSELYIQENHQGLIDRVCRHFMLTARQALQLFGDACPSEIMDKAKDTPEAPYYFLHWVLPRMDRDPERKDFKGMEYASYYISVTGKKLLAEGGYGVFPYAISRYEQEELSPYGRSVAMDALPAIKTLYAQKATVLKQGALAVDPMLLMHDDGILDGTAIESGSHMSGAVTADGRLLVQPLPVGRVDVGIELMDSERKQINEHFLVNIFQILIESPEKTATQVIEETREKGILLAPTVGRQNSEYLGPMIDRELDELSRQGELPPMPRFLKDAQGEYSIIYDSPITRTQKYEWVAGATRTINQAVEIAAQTQDPSYLDFFKFKEIIPRVAEIQGTPASWMNSEDEIAQIRAARAKQQQMQTAIEAAPAAAGIMKAVK
jgi:hypothetical protein